MKNIKLFGSAMLLMLCAATLAPAQPTAAKPKSPDALVADLYKAHNAKRSPFFQTRSRARVYQYFEKDLADLIWKDAVTSKGEVGVIDGDPLYDAQDMEIKKFAVGKPTIEGNNAKVSVTFENFGQKKTLIFLLVNGRTGWRIHDIDYGDHGTMRSWFKEK
jgi:hypothetical protein